MNILLVQVQPAVAPALRESGGADLTVRTAESVPEALAEVVRVGSDLQLVVLGTSLDDPIRLAQRVRTVNGRARIVILTEPDQHAPLCRAVALSPFLGSSATCLPENDVADVVEEFRRERRRAEQQHTYQKMLESAQAKLAEVPPLQEPSPAVYLDRLLEHAPVGVVLLDEEGRILAWNGQAGVIFGATEREAVGTPLGDFFPEYERKRLASHIAHRRNVSGPSRPETFERTDAGGSMQYVDATATEISEPNRARVSLVILQDITGRVRAEEEAHRMGQQAAVNAALARQADALKQLNEELEVRNRELQEFAYVASHDLQEPLRKITTFADLLAVEYGDRLDEGAHHFLERMQSAAVRMSRLITDLLTFSRVRTGGERFDPVDLNGVVRDVLTDLDAAIREAEARIEVDGLPTIEADASQMYQLLQNLISNALKFRASGRQPIIRVTGTVGPDGESPDGRAYCHLAVHDNGIGFDEKYLGRIFMPFQRLHTRTAYPGTGIGLAICRRIAERHGGTLTAHSVPGEGATFRCTLPVRHHQPPGER